jgi:hypothetical protein
MSCKHAHRYTHIQDVLESLFDKLQLVAVEHFALVLEHPQGQRSNKLVVLNDDELLTRVCWRAVCQNIHFGVDCKSAGLATLSVSVARGVRTIRRRRVVQA